MGIAEPPSTGHKIYVTHNDQDDYDDTTNRQIFFGHASAFEFTDRGMC